MTVQPEQRAVPTKSARTRARILDAAASVFRTQGYAARLSDIAERAGIQTGSLYYHFGSREELVAEILRLGIENAWNHVRAAVDALPSDTSPLERLATAIRAHTMAVLELSDYASAQTRIVGQVPPALASAHRREQRRYGIYWSGLLEAASEAGELAADLDLFTARMLAFGAMNWTAEWSVAQRGADATAIADQAVAVLVGGLARRPQNRQP
ncbi:MAG: TetR/AcrR family transcriptional regulator [Ilumatobacteraceae bacterium]